MRIHLIAILGSAALLACGPSQNPHAPLTGKPAPGGRAEPTPSAWSLGLTRQDGTSEVLHGVRVEDPYRWLEAGADGEVRAWADKQNEFARRYLDTRSGRGEVAGMVASLRLRSVLDVPLAAGRAGSPRRYFRAVTDPLDGHTSLVVREGPTGVERVMLTLVSDRAESFTTLSYWTPSPDGTLVAYGLSRDGEEEDTLLVRDVEQDRDLPFRAERANRSSVAWVGNRGFFYTRLPPMAGPSRSGDDLKNRSLYFHDLTQPVAADGIVDLGPTHAAEPNVVRVSPDGRYLVVQCRTGLHVRDLQKNAPVRGSPIAVTGAFDALPTNDRIVLRTTEGAVRGKIVTLPYTALEQPRWRDVVGESTDTLADTRLFGSALLLVYRRAGGVRMVRVSTEGRDATEITPPPGAAFGGKLSADVGGEEAFLYAMAAHREQVVYRLDGRSGALAAWQRAAGPRRGEDIVKERLWARSKDGTAVPLDVYHKKGQAQDGKTPTIVIGYGGFAVNALERYSGYGALADLGATVVIPGLRGGSEFGEPWHRGGMLGSKQKGFDDAIAIAELLVARRYTDPAHLGVMGGSNGGLLVGALVTQRPDLFRAAVCNNGLLDMIRYPRLRIGKIWIKEYGDPEDAQGFRWLLDYSPYHHVRSGVAYPAMLFTANDNDPRVDPAHGRKMVAALQAATQSGRPVLFRSDRVGGHGVDSQVSVEVLIDSFAFLLSELGMPL